MTGSIWVPLLAGMLAPVGIALVIASMLPSTQITALPMAVRRASATTSWPLRRVIAAIASCLVVWVLSGWPAAGVITGLAIWGLPPLLTTSRTANHRIDRVEAVEDWTRRLADVLLVGVGLEQAVLASERTAPDALRTEIGALAARIRARWSLEDALRAFADEIGDSVADLLVAALILGNRRRGAGLASALGALAASLSLEVSVRRRIEADRAKPRATARAVTFITLGVVVVAALNGSYLEPYGDPLGQLILIAVAAVFVVALSWMRSMTLSTRNYRILKASGSSARVTP